MRSHHPVGIKAVEYVKLSSLPPGVSTFEGPLTSQTEGLTCKANLPKPAKL